MAYDITGILDPKEIELLRVYAKELNGLDADMLKFLQDVDKMKTSFDKTAKSQDDIKQKSSEYSKILNKAAEDQNKLVATTKQLESQQKQLTTTEAKLKTAQTGTNKQLVKNKLELQKANKATKDLIAAQNAQKGSIEQLSAVNRILEERLKKVNQTTAEGKKKADLLRSAIDKNNKKITEFSSENGKRIRNIGNYGSAFDSLGSKFPIVSKGIGGVNNAFKLLSANPILATLLGIVGAFKLMVESMKRSEEGQNMLNKAMAFFKGGLNVLLDILTTVSAKLFEAFSNPKQAISDLWESIQTNLLNRVNAIPEFFRGIFDTVASTFSFLGNKIKLILADVPIIGKKIDAKESQKNVDEALSNMAESAKKTGQAFIQMNTGVTPDGFKEIVDGFKSVTNEIAEESKATADLQKRRDNLRIAERDFIVEREKLNTQIARARELAQDENISLEERIRLNKEAQDLAEYRASKDIEFAQERANILEAEVALGASTAEDLDELENLKAQVFLKEQERSNTVKRLLTERRTLESRFNKESVTETEETIENTEALEKAKSDQSIAFAEIEYQQRLMIMRANSKNEEDFAQKKMQLDNEILQGAINSTQTILNNSELSADERTRLETELAYQQLELQKLVDDEDAKNTEKKLARQKEIKEATLNIANEAFNLTGALFDREAEMLERKNEKGLLSEQEYAIQSAKIQRKQAIAAKAQSLFNIYISTSEAAAKVSAQTGIGALVAAPLITAFGLLQAAAVVAQPLPEIPQFYKGTTNAPDTGIFGDRGRELMQTTSGDWYMADKPTLFSDKKFKGGTIYTNKQTEQIISETQHSGFGGSSFSDKQIVNKLDNINRTIKNQPQPILLNGNHVGNRRNGNTNIYINRMRKGLNA